MERKQPVPPTLLAVTGRIVVVVVTELRQYGFWGVSVTVDRVVVKTDERFVKPTKLPTCTEGPYVGRNIERRKIHTHFSAFDLCAH